MKLQTTPSVCLPSVNPFPLKTMSKDSVVCKPDEDIMRSTSGHSPKSKTTYTHALMHSHAHTSTHIHTQAISSTPTAVKALKMLTVHTDAGGLHC